MPPVFFLATLSSIFIILRSPSCSAAKLFSLFLLLSKLSNEAKNGSQKENNNNDGDEYNNNNNGY
jgi:hypothetical protein